MIPFEAKFTGENDDRDLPAKLQAEASGILAWMVRGLTEYLETGLGSASKIDAEVAKYRAESDLLADFLTGRCVLAPEHSIQGSLLYEAYVAWSKDAGNEPMNQTVFGRRLTEKGLCSQKIKGHKHRMGITLEKSG